MVLQFISSPNTYSRQHLKRKVVLDIMKFYVFGLLLSTVLSVYGMDKCTFNGQRCFIGGYQYFPDIGYYKMYTMQSSWSDAWKQCKDDGAHLVLINNREEYEIITEMQKAAGDKSVHVGIHDLFKEGLFLTLAGEDFAVPHNFPKWENGEPNNAKNNENCVSMKANGLLNDIPCSDALYFICELNQDGSHPLIPRN